MPSTTTIPLGEHSFHSWMPPYNPSDMRLMRKIIYYHVGVELFVRGVSRKRNEGLLGQRFNEHSILSPFDKLYMAFEKDKKEYKVGEIVTLNNMKYVTQEKSLARSAFANENPTVFMIESKVKILPIPPSCTNYENVAIINRGESFNVVDVTYEDWNCKVPRKSCRRKYDGVQIVHVRKIESKVVENE